MNSINRYAWMRQEHILYPLLLALQLAVFLLLNALWDQSSTLYLRHDSLMHAQIVATYGTPYDIGCPQPRLLHSILAGWMGKFGFALWPFWVSEACFLTLWVYGTYALGGAAFSRRQGFLGASLLLWSAQATVMMRTFLLDYPYAALFTWQLYLYYRSAKFTKVGPTLAFLALIPTIAGLRYHYALYAAPLLLACAIENLPGRSPGGKRFWLGAILAVLATYIIHAHIFVHAEFGAYASCNIAQFSPTLGDLGRALRAIPAWIVGHLAELRWKNLQSLLFWMYLAGLFSVLRRTESRRQHGVLLFTLLSCAFFFSFSTYNPPRFQAPLLALRCLMATCWLTQLSRPLLWGRLALSLAILGGLCFNGAWLLPVSWPQARPALVQNDLIFANACGGDFYDFTSAYQPQRRWEYTLSQASLAKLFGCDSVWSPYPWGTVAPYKVNWEECAQQLADSLPPYQEESIAVSMVPDDNRTDELTIDDELAFLLDLGYRAHHPYARHIFFPLAHQMGTPHYLALCYDPLLSDIARPHSGQMIRRWTSQGIAVELWRI